MTTFQPSSYSRSNPAYGSAYGGEEGEGRSKWSLFKDFFVPDSAYWDDGSAEGSEPETTGGSGKSSSEPKSGPASGNYGEGGYVYSYNAVTGALTIVLSPKSASAASVAKGSPAYNAILDHIKRGIAKPVNSEALKAQREKRKAEVAAKPALVQKDFVADQVPDIPDFTGDADDPFYKQPWFIPVAVSAAVLTIGTAIILLKD